MPDELGYARRRIVDTASDDLAAEYAARITRRCRLDPVFRRQWGRYIRREIGEGDLKRALDASCEREKELADRAARG